MAPCIFRLGGLDAWREAINSLGIKTLTPSDNVVKGFVPTWGGEDRPQRRVWGELGRFFQGDHLGVFEFGAKPEERRSVGPGRGFLSIIAAFNHITHSFLVSKKSSLLVSLPPAYT